MLSQLIERFVKRLCGRWLKNFDGSQINVSLGGSVTLEDLDLKTEELRALLLPYEPVSASVRRLRLEIDPLSSSLRVDVENVDVALTAQSVFDAAEAQDAVERAVHLYFTTFLRPSKPRSQRPQRRLMNRSMSCDSIAVDCLCLSAWSCNQLDVLCEPAGLPPRVATGYRSMRTDLLV